MFTKILLFMLMALSVMVHSLNVPFDLLNWASVTQNGSPVTAGIPLPQGAVTDLSKLRITDASGNTVPAQFRALNRWWWEKNKLGTSQPSLKWVLCDFQPSTVTAKSVLSGYTLRDDFSGSTPTTQLNLTDASDKITVSTGPLKFTVNKLHFNLFDELWLDANSNSTFESNEQIITSNMQNGGTIIAGDWVAGECVNGTIHRSSESAPRFVTIEEQGPMKVVIKIEGNHYAPSNGVKMGLYGYQCFITAYSGKAFVDVQWLVTNYTIVGVPAAVKYSYISWPFSKYTLNLGLNISATQYAILGDSTEFAGAIGASDSIKLIQKRSSFTLSNTAGGKLAQGGAMLTNGQLGISVACRDFAPNNPKGITLTNNNLALELFPDTGLSKYWIDPNARKNHRMRFEFFKGNYIAGNLSDQYKQTDAPLRMLAAASWYRDTKTWERGFGYDPNDATWNRKPVSQWTRYNKRATCNQTESPQPNDWINFENFETRYSGPGDHYSFTSCFYGYLMSGMPSEFEAAEGMVFYFDACAVHTASDRFEQLTRMVNFNGVSYNTWTALWPEVSTPPVTAFPGFKWNRRDPPENGHLPNKQLLEYYLLTGDPATLDAVKSFGMFAIGLTTHDVLRYKQQPIADSIIMNGNRYTTRPGIVAGEAYEATGDERYLNRMKLTVYGMRNYVRQNPIGYDGLIDNGYNKAVSIWNYWNSIHPDIPAPKTFANADMQTGISLQDLYYYWQLTHDEEIRDATINVAKSFDWRTGRKADGKPSGAVYAPWADYLSEGKSYADIPSAATSAYWNSAAIEGWTGCNFGYLISGMSSLWEISSEGYKQMQQEGVLGNYKTTGSALQFVTFNNYGTFFLKNLNTFEAKRKHDSLDCTPPPAVQDLKAVQQGSTIQLSWTSPGGNASSYRIKVAEAPIVSEVAHWSYETHRGWPDLRNLPYTDSALINRGINYQKEQEANFWSANGISNQIIPQGEGKGESFLVTGLDPQKTWYFALVSWDTANNVSNISNVVTNKPFLTSLEIRCNKDTIAVAMKASLTASVTYSGGLIEAGNLHVRYSTPDTNIAQVTFDGFVIGRAPGKVRVIASKGVDPLTDTLTLVVILNNTKPDSLRVNMFSDAKDQWPYRVFCKGDTFPLHVATAYYHDGTNVITLPLTDSMVKWFSIDSTKAVVEYGRIILKDTGIVEVGCEYNGCRSTKTITIIAKPPVLKRINFGGVETTYCRDLIVRHGWTNDVALKYTSARGYGWPADRGGAVRCNRAGNWLVRSLVTSSGEKWRVDVPKGQYTVLMSIGDNVYIGSGYCLAGLDTIAKKNSTTLNQLCAAKVTVSSDSGMQITAYAPVNYIVILSSGYDINKYADIGIDTIPNPNMIETNSQQEIKRATLKEYPNPFNPIVTICYALPANIGATYTIYNIQGEIVFQKSLIKSSRGYRGLFVWNGVNRLTGKKAASGSYIGTLNLSDHKRISNKLLLLK